MKSVSLLLVPAFFALIFFSCKKERSAAPGSPKLYKVTFRASSSFSQTVNSTGGKQQVNALAVSSDTVAISGYSSVFRANIVNSSNVTIRQYLQNSNKDSNFGTIVDSLPAGTYTVIMAAGQGGMYMTPRGAQQIVYYQPQPPAAPFGVWNDTFVKTFQITVTNGPVNQQVVLARVNAKLEVDFKDVIPANASRVTMNLNQDDFQYQAQAATPVTPDTITYSFPVPASAIGTNTFSISHLGLNTATPFTVILTAYNSSNAVIATHTVTNVTFHANQRTILTGNFSNQATASNPGFSITVDPNWGTPSVVHY